MRSKQLALKDAMRNVLGDTTDSSLGIVLVRAVNAAVKHDNRLAWDEIKKAVCAAYDESADAFWKENGQ